MEPVKGSNAPIGAVRGGASHQGSVATAIPVSATPNAAFLFDPLVGSNAPKALFAVAPTGE